MAMVMVMCGMWNPIFDVRVIVEGRTGFSLASSHRKGKIDLTNSSTSFYMEI